MVCTGTPEKMKKRKKQNTKKEKKGKYTEIEGNEERKRSKQALRAQADSLETRLLFDGTISPVMFSADGLT